MRHLIFLAAMLAAAMMLASGGCASIPPDALTAQEKIGDGIEAARRNQMTLIRGYAEEARQRVRLAMSITAKNLITQESYSTDEVREIIEEYQSDLESQMSEIDAKERELIALTDEFFNDLRRLNDVNLDLLRSAVNLNEKYRGAFDRVGAQWPDVAPLIKP